MLYQYFSRVFRQEIIRDGFRGILGREPEEEVLRVYEVILQQLGMEGLIKDLVESDENWEKMEIRKASEGKMSKWIAWIRNV